MDYTPSPCINSEIAFPPLAAWLGDEAEFHTDREYSTGN